MRHQPGSKVRETITKVTASQFSAVQALSNLFSGDWNSRFLFKTTKLNARYIPENVNLVLIFKRWMNGKKKKQDIFFKTKRRIHTDKTTE